MNYKILMIDDDTELTELLTQYLSPEGFDVSVIHNGNEGIKKAINGHFDVIILDVMLPEKNGFEVLKSIREHIQTPVLMLTARGDDVDRIVGLEIGADDYLPKPCNPRELVARLRAILRRVPKAQNTQTKNIIVLHGITLDQQKRSVESQGKSLELTNAEFQILELLMKSPGQAFSKEELTEYALHRKYTSFDRSIDVHISNLRTKLDVDAEGELLIKTVRGFGYMFNA